jgi:hypothetical protein
MNEVPSDLANAQIALCVDTQSSMPLDEYVRRHSMDNNHGQQPLLQSSFLIARTIDLALSNLTLDMRIMMMIIFIH